MVKRHFDPVIQLSKYGQATDPTWMLTGLALSRASPLPQGLRWT